MPRPTAATTLQRADLGGLIYEYMLSPSSMGMMGLDILPVFGVQEQSADMPFMPIEALLKVQETNRATRGNYNRSDWNFETLTYSCKEKGWEEPIFDDEAALYARYFDGEMAAAERALYVVQLAREVEIAAAVFNSTTFTSYTSAVTTEWDTSASCTPLADIITAKQAMIVQPDSVAMSYKVFQNALQSAEIKDAMKYTNPVEIGGIEAQRNILAQYFGVDNVFVSNAKKDTAKKGQTYSLSDVWNDEYVFVFKRGSAPSLRDPAVGRTFLWEADSPQVATVDQYREDQSRANIYRVRNSMDPKILNAGAGYLLSNITS
jgi:hypothetical protein